MKIEKIIKKINFFHTLDKKQIQILCDFCDIITYPKNSILYYENDISNKLMFLIEGLVKIYKVDKFDNEIFLYHIHENSMISELSSINSHKIHCFSNAEFVKDSIILSIDYIKFKKNFLDENILLMELMEVLFNQKGQFQDVINRELVFDATAKVAFMLNKDLSMFNKLKRQDASFMLNIQPETLSRVLKKLSRRNIINIHNGIISICNHEALVSIFEGISI